MTKSLNRVRAGIASLTLVAGFGALAAAAEPASAAPTTRHVAPGGSNTTDCSASPCLTVQYAVDQASAGDTIDIAAGTYHESVHLRKSLTLLGAGASGSAKTVIDGDPKSGDASVFVDGRDVDGTVAVTIKDVAVDGNADDDGIDAEGAASLDLVDSSSSNNDKFGVRVDPPATATIENSTIDGNGSHGVAYGATQPANDRALAAADPDPLTISASDLSNNGGAGVLTEGNAATIDGSTLNANGESGVAAAAITGHVTISNSTLDANALAGVFTLASAGITITHSTISNSKPLSDQEQGLSFGGGVIVFTGLASIDNSTIADNAGDGVLSFEASVTVDNSTVSGTKPIDSKTFIQGGLVLETREQAVAGRARKVLGIKPSLRTTAPAAPEAGLTVTGSIVAEQDAKVPDCDGTITDGGYNLSSDADNTCNFGDAKHDLVKTDPLLGALANNGGPTKTEILKKLSPAIDAIPGGAANCSSDADDQRGIGRPQPDGGKCDMGAVELAAKPLAIHPDSLPNGTVGTAYHATITATGGQYPIYTFAFVSGTLPDGLALSPHGKITGTPTKPGTFHFTVSVNDPVFKDYTIVIEDSAPNSAGTEPVSNTGAHTGPLLAVGGAAVLAGVLLLLWVGVLDRRARGPRMVYGRHLKK